MRKKFLHVLILTLFLSIVSNNFAAQIESRMEKIIYERELDFKNVPLSDVLSIMSKSSGITIVAEDQVANTNIDLYFGRGQSLAEVIRTIKVTNGLGSRELNSVMILGKSLTESDRENGKIIGKIISRRTGEGIEGARISISGMDNHIIRSEVGGNYILPNIEPGTYILRVDSELYKSAGDIIEVQAGRVITKDLVMHLDAKAEEILDAAQQGRRESTTGRALGSTVDADGRRETTEQVRLRHALPSNVKVVVDSVIPDVNITAVEDQHLLVLRGTDENIEIARKLIDELDKPVKQVRITAQILEVTGDLTEELGIDWSFDSRPDPVGNSRTRIGLLDAGVGSTLNFISYLSNAGDAIKATLNMLQQTGDANIATVPSIVTLNGEAAVLNISEDQNIGMIERTDDNGNTIREPLFKEAGTILSVTPLIRDGEDEPDTITLTISSELSAFKPGGTDGAAIRNSAQTKVRVQDGGVIFIGGLQSTTETNTITKVPLLGDIPLLGRLFRKDRVAVNKRDLYIQIKAEIVTAENQNSDISTDGFRANTTNLNNRIF